MPDLHTLVTWPLLAAYILLQRIISKIFSPRRPRTGDRLTRGRVAIVGAGITGISSATQLVAAGYDVVLFEASHDVGGIWERVNQGSGLQIHSLMYRFHPQTVFRHAYPRREEILQQVRKVWHDYKLEKKTRFNTRVESVRPDGRTDAFQAGHHKWIVNGDKSETFDAVISCIGTCGEPNMIGSEQARKFSGTVVHSSSIDKLDIDGKRVVIVGGGASGVEAIEYCVQAPGDMKSCTLISRSDKWIIPRSLIVDVLLSLPIAPMQTLLNYCPEFLLRFLYYRDLADLAPKKSLYGSTPCLNDDVLDFIREGRVNYVKGEFQDYTHNAVVYSDRNNADATHEMEADIVILATGFKRPQADFLPQELIAEPYAPPNIYLMFFCARDASIMLMHAYKDAIATAGHFQIGMYTRALIMFLTEPGTMPTPKAMQSWVDYISWLKRISHSAKDDLTFITYGEIIAWFLLLLVSNPLRLGWSVYVLFSQFGPTVPRKTSLRNGTPKRGGNAKAKARARAQTPPPSKREKLLRTTHSPTSRPVPAVVNGNPAYAEARSHASSLKS